MYISQIILYKNKEKKVEQEAWFYGILELQDLVTDSKVTFGDMLWQKRLSCLCAGGLLIPSIPVRGNDYDLIINRL